MSNQFAKQTILIGEVIYSRPQTRVNRAYELWRENHPTATPGEFLATNCTQLTRESEFIGKWRCDDDDGSYIVKMTI